MQVTELLMWIAIAVAVLAIIAIAIGVLISSFTVALLLFAWAAGQGFIGVAAYFACWIFMFPVMLGVCLIGGTIGFFTTVLPGMVGEWWRGMFPRDQTPAHSWLTEEDEEEQRLLRWPNEDEEYEKAKNKLIQRSAEREREGDE
jgi:hypothetical protein